jgi:hypothetical protein
MDKKRAMHGAKGISQAAYRLSVTNNRRWKKEDGSKSLV